MPGGACRVIYGGLLVGYREDDIRGEEQHVAGRSRIGRADVVLPGAAGVPCRCWTIQAVAFYDLHRQEE